MLPKEIRRRFEYVNIEDIMICSRRIFLISLSTTSAKLNIASELKVIRFKRKGGQQNLGQ